MHPFTELIMVNEELDYLQECLFKDLDPELFSMTLQAWEVLDTTKKEIMRILIVR